VGDASEKALDGAFAMRLRVFDVSNQSVKDFQGRSAHGLNAGTTRVIEHLQTLDLLHVAVSLGDQGTGA
jgi:hypothetical protein